MLGKDINYRQEILKENAIVKYSLSWLVLLSLITNNASAQIIPDSSLGAENSVVNSDGNRDTINGGAIRDANLFHSFQEFNVGAGREAYFTNPNGIDNIFSRVTGNNISDIQGLLGVLGNSNLFLINPNGILFGENASLDVNGSFFATSADSVVFGNGFEFSAVNPNQPPLLTIDIPIGLRFRDNPGDIVNQSNANDVGLSVNEGKAISLIGGNVSVENGGIISAPGGRIELGGLVETGVIGIADDSSLIFPDGVVRGNISITDSFVFSEGSGSIEANARNFNLTNSIVFLTAISANQSSIETETGDITINVTENLTLNNGAQIRNFTLGEGDAGSVRIKAQDTVSLDGESRDGNPSTISSNVRPGAVGNGGEVRIDTRNLTLTNGAQITGNTFGEGSGGTIIINAKDTVTLDGESGNGFFPSAIGSSVAPSAVGNGGEVRIDTKNLTLTNGAQIQNGTFGEGSGKAIVINVADTISLDGTDGDGVGSAITTSVVPNATGNAGEVDITSKNLFLTNGAFISSSTLGEGDANSVTVRVSDSIQLSGSSPNGRGGLFTIALENNGNGGDLAVFTDELIVSDGASISASNFPTIEERNPGTGEAGDITIEANSILLENEGRINAATQSPTGEGANIILKVTEDIILRNNSLISAETFKEATGGSINLTARNLSLESDSNFNTSTFGEGDSGRILITTDKAVTLSGADTALLNTVEAGATGNSQGISIEAESLSVTDGAEISASTSGIGNAGNITLNTPQLTIDQNSSISAFTEATGDGGTITINAPQTVQITDNSSLTVETSSEGKRGNITITTPQLTIGKDAQISATATETSTNTEGGSSITINTSNLDLTGKLGIFAETQGIAPAGTLNIQPDNNQPNLDIQFRDTAIISASTSGNGTGGDINLSAPETINISGQGTIAVETTGSGNAGSIKITTQQLKVSNQTEISASTSGTGSAGNITVLGTNSVFLDNSSISTTVNAGAMVEEVAQPSNIEILSPWLSLNNGTQITASTSGVGDAGNVSLEAMETLSISNSTASSAVETGGVGTAGIVEVKANQIALSDSELSSSTAGVGNANSVIIEAKENLSLSNTNVSSAVETEAIGNAGNVNLTAPFIVVTDNSIISSSTEGEGNAGSVTVGANELIIRDGAAISASNFPSIEGTGNSGTREFGSVNIEANNITLENGRINAETQAGDNGNITLKVTEDIILRDNSLISAEAFQEATGGNIDIDANFIIAFPSEADGNDIIASAEEGTGGNINITAEAIFGIEERKATAGNRTNDIDASSEFGLSGEVSIEQPDVDPTTGLVELTQEVVDASKLIAQNVCTQTANSEFVDIGKGGLPLNPEYVLAEDAIDVGLVAPVTASSEEIETSKEPQEVKPRITRKPPAQGWIWHEDGTVELVAYNPNQIGEQRNWDNHRGCK